MTVVSTTLLYWRICIGPIEYIGAAMLASCQACCMTIVILFVIEYMIIQYLSTVWWKRPPPFNDEFAGLYLRLANCLLSLCYTFVGSCTSIYGTIIARYTGIVPEAAKPSPLQFG
jgi:hypothetical protein